MKKFFASFVMATIFLISSTAFAAFTQTVVEDADFSSVKTLAVALPMHYKVEPTEPTTLELADIVSNASRESDLIVISYDDMIENIWRDSRVDIKALENEEARKIFMNNVANYADAYIMVTSANNNDRMQIFFEVHDAKSSDLLYIYTVQNRHFKKDLRGYSRASEEFYKQFNSVVEKFVKKAKKQK